MFYNVMLVSTVQWNEVEFPVLYSRFSLVIYFTHIGVYMSFSDILTNFRNHILNIYHGQDDPILMNIPITPEDTD